MQSARPSGPKLDYYYVFFFIYFFLSFPYFFICFVIFSYVWLFFLVFLCFVIFLYFVTYDFSFFIFVKYFVWFVFIIVYFLKPLIRCPVIRLPILIEEFHTHPKTKINAPCMLHFPCMALTQQLESTWAMGVNVLCIDHMKQGYGYNPICQTICFPRSSESSWHQECENLENIMIDKTS